MAKRKQSRAEIAPTTTEAVLPAGYGPFLDDLKQRVRSAQLKAAVAVSTELIRLYWDIGRSILHRQHTEGWGTKVIDRLGHDLQVGFPGQAGFSPRNLKYIGRSRRRGRTRQLCSRLLHKSRGSTTSSFWNR